jgi:hypothetical protein
VLIRNPKQRGEWAEAQFMAKAAGHGLAVCKPWGESSRYDFVVETERGFLRLQVKSTIRRRGRGYLCLVQPRPSIPQYTGLEFDFVALYIIPEDVWYIIPSRTALTRATRTIFLSPSVSGHKYELYKEAWHLLRGTKGRRSSRHKVSRAQLSKYPRRAAQCRPRP